ncbi:fimbrial protein [Providencia sp. PROV116]|uniref:fimbrial protein n=1 Tax=Providencia sp. PROV116 TaxID=2949827 RepID=UPI00234AE386|nr:fimbrial protein [Providencia sp. PROV116]
MIYIKRITLLAILSASACGALAIDGTIQFRGAFTETPCVIDINGSNTNSTTAVSVPLGTWATENFANNVGATTDLKPITFTLSSCPDITQANIRFNGQADTTNSKLFAIQSGVDAASNVGIALYKTSSTTDFIEPNTQSLTVPLTSSSGDVTVYASYMTTDATVGGGAANADVTIDISYE